MIHYQYIDSPVDPLLLAADEHGLHLIEFHTPRHPMARSAAWIEGEQSRYSKQRARSWTNISPDHARTSTCRWHRKAPPFQKQVWHMLATIPYGQTISYAQLAQRVGKPTAMRAVGAANGRNPLPIVLPCHRVIGADGSLTGFGGGLPTKQFLLQLEGALPPATDLFGHA